MRISRRRFLQLSSRALGAAAIGIMGGGTYAFAAEPRWLEVNRYRVVLPKLPPVFSGIRLAQITDLHHSELLEKEYLEKVIARVLEEKPDMILITGDLITGYRGEVTDYQKKKKLFQFSRVTM